MSAEGCTAGGRRTAAIDQALVEDVSSLDSEAELVGLQVSSDRVQKLHNNKKGAGHVRFVK